MSAALVTIATFTNVTAASFSRMRLEADGIWCHIANEHLSAVEPLLFRAVLQVREPDAERARAILEEPLEGERADADPEDGPPCPQCQKQYAYSERVWWSVLAARITFGRVAVRTQLSCRNCRFAWVPVAPRGGPYRAGG
jgi:hypothetical protein